MNYLCVLNSSIAFRASLQQVVAPSIALSEVPVTVYLGRSRDDAAVREALVVFKKICQ